MTTRFLSNRWLLLAAAWATLGVSLFAPAWPEPFMFSRAIHTPVWVLPLFIVSWIDGFSPPRPELVLFIPAVAFVLTPLLTARRWRSSWAVLWWILVCSLWGAWALPLAYEEWSARTSSWPVIIGWSSFMWGYYLYATAHTLAFVACLMAPPAARRHSAEVGFPVVPLSSQ